MHPIGSLLKTSSIKVLIRGGGDLASGVAWRLQVSGFKVLMTELKKPLAVRRTVSFCEAVYEGQTEVEGVKALLTDSADGVAAVWEKGCIPVLVDPEAEARHAVRPDVLVDATLAKRNLGISPSHARLVIALGPGFEAGKDAHYVVETNRGHLLGRLLTCGCAQPNTGIPGPVQGVTSERVLRAPVSGAWETQKRIGDLVKQGDLLGLVQGHAVFSRIDGLLRGLIRPGTEVSAGLKIGDVDPRGDASACHTISDKALAIAGGVLEAILRTFHC